MVQKLKKNANPGSVEARINALMTGLKNMSDTINLNVVGTNYVPSSLSALLTAKKAPYVTADQAHNASTHAVAARDQAEPATVALLDAVEGVLVGYFGATNPDLKNFGIEPKKPRREMTPEERLQKAQRARATRAARKAAKANEPKAPPPQGGTTAK